MDSGKYQETYRIASARLPGWDYGSNAAYFITICTQNRIQAFGEIANGQMNLTDVGQSAQNCWNAIPEHFPFVILDEFVVMPNHVHGIVVIDQQEPRPSDINRFGPQSKNLASIVRGYKIGVTKFARQHQIPFDWQPRYHDHVIRNAQELARIRKYIKENPQNWAADCFYESK